MSSKSATQIRCLPHSLLCPFLHRSLVCGPSMSSNSGNMFYMGQAQARHFTHILSFIQSARNSPKQTYTFLPLSSKVLHVPFLDRSRGASGTCQSFPEGQRVGTARLKSGGPGHPSSEPRGGMPRGPSLPAAPPLPLEHGALPVALSFTALGTTLIRLVPSWSRCGTDILTAGEVLASQMVNLP